MIFVVPKVVEQFQDVGQQLPFLTRAVIGLSGFLAGLVVGAAARARRSASSSGCGR